jgi:formylglycine-generating enzyme required for sulfatase activity
MKLWKYAVSLSEKDAVSWYSKSLSERSRTQPAYWEDAQYNNPSQPVVGITWFEARAYCAWLTQVTGREWRLPSEVEWGAAARGQNARVYPWGEEWDADKANTLEGRVLKPSPVGAYAAVGGVGPFGTEDQSGNVWNWTSSLYVSYPYDPAKSELPETEGNCVVRGGSWNDDRRLARCAFRLRLARAGFTGHLGFRVLSPGAS